MSFSISVHINLLHSINETSGSVASFKAVSYLSGNSFFDFAKRITAASASASFVASTRQCCRVSSIVCNEIGKLYPLFFIVTLQAISKSAAAIAAAVAAALPLAGLGKFDEDSSLRNSSSCNCPMLCKCSSPSHLGYPIN